MVKNCENCAGAKDGVGCLDCRAGHTPSRWRPGANYIPPTNADRIRAMSDEELASFLLFFVPTTFSKEMYTGVSGKYDTSAEVAIRHSLDWLTQPAKEE